MIKRSKENAIGAETTVTVKVTGAAFAIQTDMTDETEAAGKTAGIDATIGAAMTAVAVDMMAIIVTGIAATIIAETIMAIIITAVIDAGIITNHLSVLALTLEMPLTTHTDGPRRHIVFISPAVGHIQITVIA